MQQRRHTEAWSCRRAGNNGRRVDRANHCLPHYGGTVGWRGVLLQGYFYSEIGPTPEWNSVSRSVPPVL